MHFYRVTIAILLFVPSLTNSTQAYSSRIVAHGSDIRTLVQCVEVYRIDKAVFPITDSESTWYEKLIEAEPAIHGMLNTTADGKYPLGYYGTPIIYEPPSPSNGNRVVIRDVGKNGVDDSGKLDDWDSRHGPNSGYWYKADWPTAYRRAWICAFLALIGMVVIAIKIKQGMARIVFALLWLGFLAGVVLPFGFFYISRFTYPPEIGFVTDVGALLLLIGIVLLVLHIFCTIYYRRSLRIAGTIPCKKCSYDLRGTIAANITRCPECGESVP